MTLTATQWDDFVTAHRGHLLQSWAWGELKSSFGWTPVRVQLANAGAQILFRRLPLGLTIAYIPKGPLVDWNNQEQCQALLATIHAEARRRRAVFLKVEPNLSRSNFHGVRHPQMPNGAASEDAGSSNLDLLNLWNATASSSNFFLQAGFKPADTIQPRTTLVLDLDRDDQAILTAMKQKTRYNIRLAQKKGVTVRQGLADDVSLFHRLALTTADRSNFGVHSLGYYQSAYRLFSPDRCALFIAEFEAEPVATLLAFRQGKDAYYFYGASSNQHRNLMAPYLVQWAAIRWAREGGCTRYDLWGIPNADAATLEAEFKYRRDGLWGVYRFKRGFGGEVVQSIGAYDFVYKPLLYRLYRLRR